MGKDNLMAALSNSYLAEVVTAFKLDSERVIFGSLEEQTPLITKYEG